MYSSAIQTSRDDQGSLNFFFETFVGERKPSSASSVDIGANEMQLHDCAANSSSDVTVIDSPLRAGTQRESAKMGETTSRGITFSEKENSHPAKTPLSIWTDGWLSEILSCGVAVLALAFLVVTLRHYDGVILTTLPRFINFNTVIAIIGATIKAAILLPVAESKSSLMF